MSSRLHAYLSEEIRAEIEGEGYRRAVRRLTRVLLRKDETIDEYCKAAQKDQEGIVAGPLGTGAARYSPKLAALLQEVDCCPDVSAKTSLRGIISVFVRKEEERILRNILPEYICKEAEKIVVGTGVKISVLTGGCIMASWVETQGNERKGWCGFFSCLQGLFDAITRHSGETNAKV